MKRILGILIRPDYGHPNLLSRDNRNEDADREAKEFVKELAHNVYESGSHEREGIPIWARAIIILLIEIYTELKKP